MRVYVKPAEKLRFVRAETRTSNYFLGLAFKSSVSVDRVSSVPVAKALERRVEGEKFLLEHFVT